MTLSLEAKPEKPWLSAYQGLDTTIKVEIPLKEKVDRTVPWRSYLYKLWVTWRARAWRCRTVAIVSSLSLRERQGNPRSTAW